LYFCISFIQALELFPFTIGNGIGIRYAFRLRGRDSAT
jgi:hypothetical protein